MKHFMQKFKHTNGFSFYLASLQHSFLTNLSDCNGSFGFTMQDGKLCIGKLRTKRVSGKPDKRVANSPK